MTRSTPPTDAADSAVRPDPLDAVLRAWPDGPSAAGARDTALAAILSRLDAPLPDASSRIDDEQLLVAPMAEERDESAPSQPPVSLDGKSTRRERRTFQDIAKLAGPPSSKAASAADEWKEDSGVVDLKVPTAEPEATKPVLGAAAVVAPISVAPSATPAAVVAAVAPSTPPAPVAPTTSTPAAAVASPMAAKQAEKKGGNVVFIGLFAAAAVAAGVFFVAKGKPEEKKPDAPVAVATAETTKPNEPAAKTEEKKPDPAAAALSPEALAAAEKAKTTSPAAGGTPTAATGGATAGTAATTAKPEEKKPEIPVGEPGSLTAAMAQAAGPIDTSKTAATAQTGPVGNVPQRPSQGAVTGAMGKVLSAARACVTDDSASKATVTFAPSGAASGVSVSGPAAGTGAESCIKSALMRANVGAFAESTYSTTVTIRH